jgi:hypothetical protein
MVPTSTEYPAGHVVSFPDEGTPHRNAASAWDQIQHSMHFTMPDAHRATQAGPCEPEVELKQRLDGHCEERRKILYADTAQYTGPQVVGSVSQA